MLIVLGVLALAFASGCTAAPQASPTPTPLSPVTPAPTRQATPQPTPQPSPLSFPELSGEALDPGRYDASPPFAIKFTFEIPDDGWSSAHIHDEFFDVMRFDGPDPNIPTRWVAWGYPDTIHGPDGEQPVAGLTAEEAIELMSNVPNVEASDPRPFSISGIDGIQADLHTDVAMTQLFGGGAGDFALEPAFDVRLGAVDLDPGLLLVMCFGPDGDLEDGCADAQPIINSVEIIQN